MRENGLKLHKVCFSLDIRKSFFQDRLVKYCKRQPREVGESPYLEVFKQQEGVSHEDMV